MKETFAENLVYAISHKNNFVTAHLGHMLAGTVETNYDWSITGDWKGAPIIIYVEMYTMLTKSMDHAMTFLVQKDKNSEIDYTIWEDSPCLTWRGSKDKKLYLVQGNCKILVESPRELRSLAVALKCCILASICTNALHGRFVDKVMQETEAFGSKFPNDFPLNLWCQVSGCSNQDYATFQISQFWLAHWLSLKSMHLLNQ